MEIYSPCYRTVTGKGNGLMVKNIGRIQQFKTNIIKDRYLYIMMMPSFILLLIFHYVPIYGITLAFKDYSAAKGILGSTWVGLKYIDMFIHDPFLWRIFRNTILLGVYGLIFAFPASIILAIMFNEVRNKAFKKISQTVSYLPYFISTVIIVGIMKELLSMDGVVNSIISNTGGEKINFFSEAGWFRTLFISSGIWQGLGWGSIIYIAAIAGISEELYEASVIEGANRFQQTMYITIPCIAPTINIMFILSVGSILGASFEKVYLMYSPGIYETADVISTYVYRRGIEGGSFSYATAVGLINSIVSFLFMWAANMVSRKTQGNSLW
jgi:ABC-type polysaccharide transport system, permease component